jgi:hypothetical protein
MAVYILYAPGYAAFYKEYKAYTREIKSNKM